MNLCRMNGPKFPSQRRILRQLVFAFLIASKLGLAHCLKSQHAWTPCTRTLPTSSLLCSAFPVECLQSCLEVRQWSHSMTYAGSHTHTHLVTHRQIDPLESSTLHHMRLDCHHMSTFVCIYKCIHFVRICNARRFLDCVHTYDLGCTADICILYAPFVSCNVRHDKT